MQQLSPQRQRMLMRIIYRLRRFWMTFLVVIVVIPIILTVWYGIHSLWHIPPITITVTQPFDTHNIAINQPITLVFSRHISPNALTTALQIAPYHQYRTTWDTNNTTLTITPTTPWQPDTRYNLTITPDPSVDGGIDHAWNMQFTTAPGLHIQTLIPENKSHDVTLSTSAVIRFSQPMVAQHQVAQSIPNTLLQITPPISGTIEWLDQTTLVFRPDHWRADSRYTITNTPQLLDIQGQQLSTPLIWQFHTIATHIDQVIPANNSQNIALNTPIIFKVTGVVDTRLLRASIALAPATPTRIDIVASDNDSINVIITPQPQWQIGTTYQIQIGGAATTLAYQHIRFTTTPALRLIARSPGDGQILAPNQDVRFVFNTDIDTQTITDAVSLTPPPLHPAKITSNGHDIRVMALWPANTQPIITIDANLHSSTGITLSTAISSQLQIDTTISRLILPGSSGSIVPFTPKTGIVIDSQNIHTLHLQLYALPPAMLIRVLGMDNLTLQQLDPERYNLPLLDTQTITNPQNVQRFVVPPSIWQTPPSRYLLAIGKGNNGSSDIRVMRILPSTLNIITLGGKIIAGTRTTQSDTPSTITLFQEGQLVEQAQSDARGIWISRPHPQGTKFVVLDDSNPPDAAVVTITQPSLQSAPIHIISNHTTAVIGSQIDITAARSDNTLPPRNSQISLCDATGMQIQTQPMTFAQHQTATQVTITIPDNIAFGIYTVCGDDIVDAPTIIIHPPPSTHLVIHQHPASREGYDGTVTDNAMQPIANATIYWRQNTQTGTTTSNVNGEFHFNTTTDAPITIVAYIHGESVITIVPPTPQRTLRIDTPQQWVQSGKYSTVHLQIDDPNNQNLVRPIKLTVKNTKGYVAIRRTVTSDAQGHVALALAIPQGQWLITATDGELTHQQSFTVGTVPTTPFLVPEMPIIYSNDVMRFFYGTTTPATALVAQFDASGIHAAWTPIQNGIISTTVPISTTMLTIAAQTATGPLRQYISTVSTPMCNATTIKQQAITHGTIPLTFTTSPHSTVAIRVQRPIDGKLWEWYPALHSDANGIVSLNLADDNQSTTFIIDVLQHNPACVRNNQVVLPIIRTQQLSINAPTVSRIGDDVVITVTLKDSVPVSQSSLTITSTGMTLNGAPRDNAIMSDANGVNTQYWHAKITALHPQLTLSSSRGARVSWQPLVTVPITHTTQDGFMLQGKTIVNTDNSTLVFDVISQRDELFRAMMNEPYDPNNPSHLAYRLWLSDSPTERNQLRTRLMLIQSPTGGWSWGNNLPPDPLITTDVVSAFASAGIPPTNYQSAITYLQQQVNNPQLPATIHALIVRALVQTGWNDARIFAQLCANPTVLGNEGLAALLLTLPYDHAYAIPALLTELLSRSHQSPRGLTWDSDPATAAFHSSDSVNALILQATLRTSVSTSITNQIQSMLLSSRGSDGWSDIITNARMWSMHDTLFQTLDGHQKISIFDQHGHLNQNNSVSPGIALNEDVTITSNAPVLVGITHPQSTPIDSDTVRLLRRYTTANGQLLTADTLLRVGDIIAVELEVITFAPIPYLTIQEPLPTIGEIISLTPPRNSYVTIDNALLTLYSATASPTIMKCHYRIKITSAGSITIPSSTAYDVAGTWQAQSQPQSIYVPTP
jgi:Bacterial Ig-like domain